MKNGIIMHDISPEQLVSLFKELQNQLTEIKENLVPKTPTEFLSRNEVADLLKCDLSTIWAWTKKGTLKSYGVGNRIYYKRSEIENTLICLNGNNQSRTNPNR